MNDQGGVSVNARFEPMRKSLVGFVKGYNFSLVLATVVITIVLSILSPYFFSFKNFVNLGLSAAVVGTMAAGMTVAMLMGAMDMSQYSIAALSAVVMTTLLINTHLPIAVIFVIGILVGVVCGLVNGALVTVFKIAPIIATLGTMNIFRSICYILTSSRILGIDNPFFFFIGRGFFLGIPMSLWIMAFVYLVVAFILKATPFGRMVFAVGANPNASHLAGIDVKSVRLGGLLISAVTSSIAGIVSAAQVSSAIPMAGVGAEMDIVTAVLIGGLSLSGGKGKISGTLLGLIIIVIINNGLTLLSVQSYYQMLVRGVVLVLAVLIDSMRGGGYK
jgi:ribose/xylose/arabinose/galactoside ABC-type transport system permease subunit